MGTSSSRYYYDYPNYQYDRCSRRYKNRQSRNWSGGGCGGSAGIPGLAVWGGGYSGGGCGGGGSCGGGGGGGG